jgi:hypothetical protein
MGLSVYPPSGGITTSDLITEPNWTLVTSIASQTGAGSISFTSLSGYKRYRILIGMMRPTSGSAFMGLRFNSDDTQKYYMYSKREYSNQTQNGYVGNTSTNIELNNSSISINQYNYGMGFIDIFAANGTTTPKQVRSMLTYRYGGTSNIAREEVAGFYYGTSAVSSILITFFGDSVNLENIYLLGGN